MRVSRCLLSCLVLSAVCWTCAVADTKPRRRHRRRKNKHVARSANLKPPFSGQLVRLTHEIGGNMTSGMVEVFLDGQYGIVCDDKWDVNDADVVCKQMGFTSGAEKALQQFPVGIQRYDDDDILMDDVTCERNAEKIQDCRWVFPSDCAVDEAAGVVCKENKGCPDGWTAGPTGCYLLPRNIVTKRDYAINKCIKQGGHLVTIETEQENNFLSNAFAHEIGPILTGGVKKGGGWKWETVEERLEEDSRHSGTTRAARHTTREPIEYTKWFSGFQPGNVYKEPTRKKKERCLFMTTIFEHPNGSDVTLDYLYWQSDQCTSTRKRMSTGYKYICEQPRKITLGDVGCYHGIGTQYRGSASTTLQGTSCMKWTLDTDINPSSFPDSGLGDHNYCRNPDNDERPWCWVEPGNFEFCDVPQCVEETVEDNQEQQAVTCAPNQFMCSDKSCIADLWICDHEYDCPEKEDELRCEYNLTLFTKLKGRSFRDQMVETFAGTTNETCAKYCLEADKFVCRSFTYVPRTRECMLSDKNSQLMVPRTSRREDLYELTSLINGCSEDTFLCSNGQCIPEDQVCDGVNQCHDASDETDCDNTGSETELEVRIAGSDKFSGAVEVRYLGQWGLICDDKWDDQDASVVCRMLGYTGESKAVINMEQISDSKLEMFLDEVQCTGSETTLADCSHDDWMNHDCFKWEVAGVQCSQENTNNITCDDSIEVICRDRETCIKQKAVCDGECDCNSCTDEHDCEPVISLHEGATASEGRVQISMGGVIGTICDDKFDDLDATVVCRALGYGSGTHATNNRYPAGSGVIWMDDVECEGEEEDLFQCPHVDRYNHDCGHDEDVGVICHKHEVTTASPNSIEVYLVGGDDELSGRVEVMKNDERGTICDDKFDEAAAHIICTMLGHSGGEVKSFGPGSDSVPIVLDDVACTGDEASILDCTGSDWKDHDCTHSEDVGVVCYSGVPTPTPSEEPTAEPEPAGEDCITEGEIYLGQISETEHEYECQPWSLDEPHEHKYHNDSMFPDGSVTEASNYCRNPDGDERPWCYTVDPDERWAYCNIPECKENCFSVASQYTGITSETQEGFICQPWAQNNPHDHKYHDDEMFPDLSVEGASNYCRAPDDDVTPWCYTQNENIRWQYCDVPTCAKSTPNSSNVTCGNRPLELSRRRRDADESDDLSDDDDSLIDKENIKYYKRGKIYGGNIAVYGMNPWQVGIRKKVSYGFLAYGLHHCGGTIINEYWILSAAHCFRDLTKGQVTVRTGDHDHHRADKHEQEFSADLVIAHELYNKNMDYDFDIALIKIKPIAGRGIIFNDYVQPACLPDDDTQYIPGQKCLISGWGAHEEDSQSDMLLSTRVPLVDDRTCSRLYKGEITSNMVCAGYLAGGSDSCTGDSGGPLVCKVNGKYTVMGVTSFGQGCGDANAPGVYARVKSLLPWIRRTLDSFG